MVSAASSDKRDEYRQLRNGLIWAIIVINIATRIIFNFIEFTETSALITNIIMLIIFFSMQILVCLFWAMYKARSKWFALLGFIGWIGYIPLALLKDKGKPGQAATPVLAVSQ